jgi:hypothetical protein
LHKYSFSKDQGSLDRFYHVNVKSENTSCFRIYSQADFIFLIKEDKKSIIGAFLFAVLDPEHLSIEDWIIDKKFESHFGEAIIKF